MSKSASKLQSWQIFHFSRKHLGSSLLYTIFGRKNARAIDYWCQDPKFTAKADGAYDPIQGIKALVESLDDRGHCGVVRATMAYLSEGTSCSIDHDQKIIEPQATISAEILSDYRAVAEMQQAIEQGSDVIMVEKLLQEAIAELERTFARYKQDMEDEK